MASRDHSEQEARLAHLQQRFRSAEPRSSRTAVWKQIRSIGKSGALIALGVLIGGGAFLALDALKPPAEHRELLSLRPVFYQTCREAFQDGRVNMRRGEPGYRPELDADQDGLACEPFIRR